MISRNGLARQFIRSGIEVPDFSTGYINAPVSVKHTFLRQVKRSYGRSECSSWGPAYQMGKVSAFTGILRMEFKETHTGGGKLGLLEDGKSEPRKNGPGNAAF
jgi:hypothetical protein